LEADQRLASLRVASARRRGGRRPSRLAQVAKLVERDYLAALPIVG
jgi:hypothetical protein